MAQEPKEDTRTPLEKFHAGVPLTPGLKEVKNGVETANARAAVVAMPRPEIRDALRSLTKSEIADLRDMRAHPGYLILERLKEKTLQTHEKSAIAKSQIDPLAQTDEVVHAWAYLKMMREAYFKLAMEIEMAIKVDGNV